ncbi:MAG TPA: hypothetical protein VNV41_07590 [Candidatus Acidoferrales bacterium]|jgi:hypothetical protein|nr:hypothetical protein [Candidatus Acidoferrales bacterium]
MAPQKQIQEVDLTVENHGSIFLLQGHTVSATEWINEHLPEDRQTFGGAVVVEPRYIGPIVRGAMADGLVVR